MRVDNYELKLIFFKETPGGHCDGSALESRPSRCGHGAEIKEVNRDE